MNLIFLPGFLGDQSDFEETIALLKPKISNGAKIIYLDYLNANSKYRLLQEPSEWSAHVVMQMRKENFDFNDTYLIGYSMGGRLALLLLKESLSVAGLNGFKRVIALSANPGIQQESTIERSAWVKKWVLEFNDFEQGLKKWNEQNIFKNSAQRNKVGRGVTQETVKLALENYDYQRLPLSLKDLKALNDRVRFLFGENDEKYQRIKQQINAELGVNLCFDVPKAGHRLPFDAPSNTASLLQECLT
jgi:pimeloyl-ACP methyl ester carboxylesterase